ncbi:MAG: glycosyltransferase [Candidatus Woesearchaeota archaeon]
MTSKLLSIIIPNFNGEESIRDTIKSAELSARGIKFEVIVVDDCSTDDSQKILKRINRNDRRLKVINNIKRRGAAFCRNIGAKKAEGKVLLFIDNDVFLKGDTAKKLVKSALHNRGVSFPKIRFSNRRIMWPASKEEEKFLGISACFAIPKKLFKRVGFFDEAYETYLEDADFFVRCKLNGVGFYYEKNAVAIHKVPKFYDGTRRYFLENRNLTYGMLKFLKIPKKEKSPFVLSSLLKNLVCGLFNFRWFDWSYYDRNLNFKEKVNLLFRKHRKLSQNCGCFTVLVFFVGIITGLFRFFISKSKTTFINK